MVANVGHVEENVLSEYQDSAATLCAFLGCTPPDGRRLFTGALRVAMSISDQAENGKYRVVPATSAAYNNHIDHLWK
jgi:hypothetical protein